jgi:hypothetical protein
MVKNGRFLASGGGGGIFAKDPLAVKELNDSNSQSLYSVMSHQMDSTDRFISPDEK